MGTEKSKSKLEKSLKRTAVFVVMIIISFFAGILLTKYSEHKKAEEEASVAVMEQITAVVSIDEVMSQINAIDELATVEYLYTDSGKFEDKKQFESGWLDGVDIPLTQKSFIVRWDGRIKAGISIGDVVCDIDETAKTITVTMPEAEILSHEVFEDSFETLDQTNNIFNPVAVDDVNKFIGESKGFMEKKAVENGLIESADKNAQALIENSLESIELIRTDYTIVFEKFSEDKQGATDE
ncbi:MAG: DUF4230 domain-containing protein [Ruminococcus flavefaciens]|nr:DUF4230 domain-containing protein [Ruminococcus flavefaciens]MCM1229418.1 DUF4230 domain-containing protein [Ruminococcus flavefaciens]